VRRLWPIALLLALSGCRTHVQDEGTYDFTSTAVVRDDCGLIGSGLSWTGDLTLSGDYLRLETNLLGQLKGTSDTSAQVQLIGQYRLREENFSADGSAGNVSAEASGTQCIVDLVNVHIEAVSVDPTHFSGTARVSYQTRVNNGCTCEAWVSYSAVHQ
jgi:hypothetical protein